MAKELGVAAPTVNEIVRRRRATRRDASRSVCWRLCRRGRVLASPTHVGCVRSTQWLTALFTFCCSSLHRWVGRLLRHAAGGSRFSITWLCRHCCRSVQRQLLWLAMRTVPSHMLLALLVFHVSAALYHRFILHDEVLARMLPNGRRPPRGYDSGSKPSVRVLANVVHLLLSRMIPRRALVTACVAGSLGARVLQCQGAPEEIQVYIDDMSAPGISA